jgi:protein TonB
LPPPVIARPLSRPSQQDLPLVPGEVKEVGKPLPGAGYPRIGKGGGKGEADVKDTRNAVESAKPGSHGKPNLFDTGVTEAIARKDPGKAGNKIKKDDVITFDTSIYRYAGYMNKLRDRIQSVWKYPPEAAAKGISADLKIRFTIKKDGRLGAVELMSTSGYPMLDDAAVKALKDGEPYWPLPSDWGMDSYTIEGHFIYSLYGYYLR